MSEKKTGEVARQSKASEGERSTHRYGVTGRECREHATVRLEPRKQSRKDPDIAEGDERRHEENPERVVVLKQSDGFNRGDGPARERRYDENSEHVGRDCRFVLFEQAICNKAHEEELDH